MLNSQRLTIFLFIFIIVACLVAGLVSCAQTPKPTVTTAQPLSCEEHLATVPLSQFNNQEIVAFLDDSYSSKKESCWLPMVKKCLEENRYLPYDHLKYAVKELNQHRYSRYFHDAVYRYFQSIILNTPGGAISFSQEDKRFLEAYVSYAVQHSTSRDSQMLNRAKDICRRLDPDLFNQVFK